jgi:hypothetical protein
LEQFRNHDAMAPATRENCGSACSSYKSLCRLSRICQIDHALGCRCHPKSQTLTCNGEKLCQCPPFDPHPTLVAYRRVERSPD